MKTIRADTDKALSLAADRVAELLRRNTNACIALSAHDDCLRLYRVLRERSRAGQTDLSGARYFALSEFEGLPADDPRSCRSRLKEALLDEADPDGERSLFLTAENAADYDARIAGAGGLDLAILGLGPRGRVGFNEPATPFDSVTHRQKLTKASRRELAALFGGEEQVPEFGLTMGVRTLMGAKESLVVALGPERADPVFRMLYARTDSFVPAAFLQLALEVDIILDPAAAEKL